MGEDEYDIVPVETDTDRRKRQLQRADVQRTNPEFLANADALVGNLFDRAEQLYRRNPDSEEVAISSMSIEQHTYPYKSGFFRQKTVWETTTKITTPNIYIKRRQK